MIDFVAEYSPFAMFFLLAVMFIFHPKEKSFTIDDIQEREGDEFHIKVTFKYANTFKTWTEEKEYRILDNGRIYSYPKAVEVDESFHKRLNQKFLQEVWAAEREQK